MLSFKKIIMRNGEVNVIPDVSDMLTWLEQHGDVLKGINRGIERETLRVKSNGELSSNPFPSKIGAALTHKWITTDFAESMLEFITPVFQDVDESLAFLHDLHRFAASNVDDELFWPFSMPCFVADPDNVKLAQYGKSNKGRFKTVYRKGLKLRYGAMMQTISGVHYNFSLPFSFWQKKIGVTDPVSGRAAISAEYFRLIRNYYRFGWIIPYLFGASPALCTSSIQASSCKCNDFEQTSSNNNCYLPYATSLRLSDSGYASESQRSLGITFNDLETYVAGLKQATKRKSDVFTRLGIFDVKGDCQQLNDHILQIENEFYAPIRPKTVPEEGELPSDGLLKRGIQYIEVRALDVNPFSPVGITAEQIRFLDLFLIWCLLADAPEMSASELQCAKKNWDSVSTEGRKPGLMLTVGCTQQQVPLVEVGKRLFDDLLRVADVIDKTADKAEYRPVIKSLSGCFDHPERTLSARLLTLVKEGGESNISMLLANQYQQKLQSTPYKILTPAQFEAENRRSFAEQTEIENSDHCTFDDYVRQNG